MRYFTLILVLTAVFVAGCDNVPSADPPDKNKVFNRYDSIVLGKDTSATVLQKLYNKSLDKEEYLSQSESVVAKWAQRGKYDPLLIQRGAYAVVWFNIVAFDEESMTAKRKYAFLSDEDSPGWWALLGASSQKMRFDMEMIMDDGVLDQPYTSASDKWIAIIEESKKLYLDDARDIRKDSHAIDSISLLINETFNQILMQIKNSPALTQRIDQASGLSFDHSVLNEGRLLIVIDAASKTVDVKIKLGSSTEDFANQSDVKKLVDKQSTSSSKETVVTDDSEEKVGNTDSLDDNDAQVTDDDSVKK